MNILRKNTKSLITFDNGLYGQPLTIGCSLLHLFVQNVFKIRSHAEMRYAGVFCDGMCSNAVLEVLSQKDASWSGVPEHFFWGGGVIGVTNTTHTSPAEFWVTLRSGTFFERK
jgi:hypothetical protein